VIIGDLNEFGFLPNFFWKSNIIVSLVVFAQPQKYGKAMSTIPSKYGFKKIARDIAIEPLFQKFEHVYKVIHGSFRLTARLGVSPRPLAKSKRFPTDCYEIRFFFLRSWRDIGNTSRCSSPNLCNFGGWILMVNARTTPWFRTATWRQWWPWCTWAAKNLIWSGNVWQLFSGKRASPTRSNYEIKLIRHVISG